MKILLTGGAGYVGSACLRWLLAKGHDPIAYDNMSEGNTAAVPDAHTRLVVGDIADTDRLARVLRDHGAEAVMHFAALASVPDSISDPEAYYRVNVAGTKSVLDAMRTAGVTEDPLQQHRGYLWVSRRDAALGAVTADPRDAVRYNQAGRRVAYQRLRPRLRARLHAAAVL